MKNRTFLPRITGFMLLALASVAFAGAVAWAAAAKSAGEKRADVIVIDAKTAGGKREFPAVTFLHDQHTKAVEAAGKDCSSCHNLLPGSNTAYSFAFLGADAVHGDAALKLFFHTNCIGCHAEMRGSAKTGPQEAECRSCHNAAPPFVVDQQTVNLDKVLHYQHIASSHITYAGSDKNCGACHTAHDPKKNAMVWAEGKEDAWRASYLPSAERAAILKRNPDALDSQGRPLAAQLTLAQYSHQACVNCHLSTTPPAKTGPVDCAGCHSSATQAAWAAEAAKLAPTVPRLLRGQDDSMLMLPPPSRDGQPLKGMMAPVSFDHKFHESVTMSCGACHHKRIDSCSSCHSLEGKKEGNFVNFAQAMHSGTASQSCVGCHNIEKQDRSCAGCHAIAPARPPQQSCASCHATPAGVSPEVAESGYLLTIDKDSRRALAMMTVSGRDNKRVSTFSRDDIPETVTIGVLSDQYEPSMMPHGKIVDTLLEMQKTNRMAATFHMEEATLCQGCHHRSPPSKTPPKCVSCHAIEDKQPSANSLLTLRAAYHQQCISCHERMDQKPFANDCASCHKPRGN
jgi:hypothetical protein